MHFGLLPRANRGIFAINELPDLAGKIQVGLLQHPAGGRRPDQGLPGAPAARRHDGLHGQPGGLHRARQDHHAAQGPHRRRDPHALPANRAPTRWPITDAGSLGRARPARRRAGLRARGGRGDRLPGARRPPGRPALGREPAPADQRARERGLERRAARAWRRRGRWSCRGSPTSTPPCRRSPARSSSNTRASSRARTPSPANSSAAPSRRCSTATSWTPTSRPPSTGSTTAAR